MKKLKKALSALIKAEKLYEKTGLDSSVEFDAAFARIENCIIAKFPKLYDEYINAVAQECGNYKETLYRLIK